MPYFSVLGMLKYDDSLVGQLTRCRALHNLCTSQVITTLISYRCHLIMTKKVMVMVIAKSMYWSEACTLQRQGTRLAPAQLIAEQV